ncbi:hypothetical protein LguiB_022908 [Lonicera macranthoides]
MEITEEQRQRAEANRRAALAKRKRLADGQQDPWKLFKCRKVSPEHNPVFPKPQDNKVPLAPIVKPLTPDQLPDKFRVRLEICSKDSFSITPEAIQGFRFPGEAHCLEKLRDCLSNVVPTHYTQNSGGGRASVYKLGDYRAVQRCLKPCRGVEIDDIPWGTFNVIEKLSNSVTPGQWIPCRPEHLPDEKVDELIERLPKSLVQSLLPFQYEGVQFGLRRGGRCLIADEMGLGKTLQAIAIAGCFMSEGSILVVCPAILRFSWAEEIERWLPTCLPSDIHLVFGHQNNPANLPRCPKVVVISYTMLHRLRKSLLELDWAVLIVDESHHVRCTKKPSEPGEEFPTSILCSTHFSFVIHQIKAVLDVATKVKHIVLLSGTPSLSRDGLLGKTKYEFAKTYCSVQFVRGCQGRVFQDFSKGIRLEELHLLLKQTVMIRRLKEQVLEELPPKRRQILRLILKRSDIDLAIDACKVVNSDASANNDTEDGPLHIAADAPDVNGGRCQSTRKLSHQEVGIAKLSGFCEWLSFHPIIAEMDADENMGKSISSHKMIIFAHHHKVLDRVQVPGWSWKTSRNNEFVCNKGIGFVRIDGNTSAGDRQLAVQSFQSSKEAYATGLLLQVQSDVKIAIIGILAGGAGLNLSAAQNVVFLELPKEPAHLLQVGVSTVIGRSRIQLRMLKISGVYVAEDRAHRRNQANAVHVYIFCAKDTSDESHWQNLNKSLHRVSSTMNGKYDAIQEIELHQSFRTSTFHPCFILIMDRSPRFGSTRVTIALLRFAFTMALVGSLNQATANELPAHFSTGMRSEPQAPPTAWELMVSCSISLSDGVLFTLPSQGSGGGWLWEETVVENISYLETTGKTDCVNENQFVERANEDVSAVKLVEFPKPCFHQYLQPDEEQDDSGCYSSQNKLETEVGIASDPEMGMRAGGNTFEDKVETAARISRHNLVDGTEGNGQMEVNKKFPEAAELEKGESFKLIEADACISSEVNFLRFEVSQYTGRIHLYSCIPGVDLRPRPLFENFRPEELELQPPTEDSMKMDSKCIKEDLRYRNALVAFIKEWNSLRPIEQKKLLLKPLQLPLSVELCCLDESLNHDSGGLLKGGSKKRRTSLEDIGEPLPPNACWRKVRLGNGKKEREYEQGWTLMDEPLCKLCQAPCLSSNAKKPEFFEDLFCELRCYEEYRLRTSNRYLREGLFQIEHGICTSCQLNCHKLVEHIRPLSFEKRQEYIKKVAPELAKRMKLFDKLVLDPTEGNAWHADHIVPVYQGGGECTLENMRTLCVACHADVTAAQGAERRSRNAKARKQLKAILRNVQNSGKIDARQKGYATKAINETKLNDSPSVEVSSDRIRPTNVNYEYTLTTALKPQSLSRGIVNCGESECGQMKIQENGEHEDDELLIEVPGSSYSGVKIISNDGQQENEKPSNLSESTRPNSCEES